jgi:hypothetical protein
MQLFSQSCLSGTIVSYGEKLQEKYDMSKATEDDFTPSTSGQDAFSSTSPMCRKTQGNDMVTRDENSNSELTFSDHSSLSHCNALSLEQF